MFETISYMLSPLLPPWKFPETSRETLQVTRFAQSAHTYQNWNVNLHVLTEVISATMLETILIPHRHYLRYEISDRTKYVNGFEVMRLITLLYYMICCEITVCISNSTLVQNICIKSGM